MPIPTPLSTLKTISITLIPLLFSQHVAKAQAGPTEPTYLYKANVVRAVDGDTIDVDIDLGFYTWIKRQRIRLVKINAPEPKLDTKSAGDAATKYLEDRIEGRQVILRSIKATDGGEKKGKFGRWLGTVYLDGVNINSEMVTAVHAVACTYDHQLFPDLPSC